MDNGKMKEKISINLKPFDMNWISDDKVIVLIGKRNTGKSVLVKDLLFYHQSIPIVSVISATEHANRFYADFVPSIFIHDEYQPEIIKNVVCRQHKIIEQLQQEQKYGRISNQIDPRAALILDDCLYDDKWTRDKYIKSIFMNGRHYKLLFLVTMQYPLGIPPSLRCNVDYIFILRENIVKNRERIFQNYAGMFPNFDVFNQVMDQTTENYGCLVIDNTSKSNKFEDQVYWYKADINVSNSGFSMCDQQFWEMSRLRDQQREQEKEDNVLKELQELTQKKNTIKINVKKKQI